MLSKSVLLACLLFSSNSVVKSQISTSIPNNTSIPNSTAIPNTTTIPNNSTIIPQQQMNCTVQDDEIPEVQSGLNNFVIDTLDDTFPFPFALNQCTSASLLPSTKRYKYECTENNGVPTVTKTEYNNVNCSGSGSIVEQFSEDNATAGAKGYFDCSGSDAYIQIEFSFNSTCQNSVTVYGALGSCSSFMMNNSVQMNMYCNDNEAVMQIFNLMNSLNATNETSSTFAPFNATLSSLLNDTSALPSTSNQPQSTMCTDDTFCDKWAISTQCNMITSFPLLGNNQTLYGRMVGCIVDDISMSSTQLMSSTNLNITSMSTTNLNITFMSTTNLNISVTDLNISVTELNATIGATGGETSSTTTLSSTSTTGSTTTTTSGAIRSSFLFGSNLLLLLSFLFSV